MTFNRFPLSEAPFNFTPPIINQEIFTFANQPHEIVGYLQHHAVVKQLLSLSNKNIYKRIYFLKFELFLSA